MKILAFGAHPDDIEIGMGGTIRKYSANGHTVLMVVATVPNEKAARRKEAGEAAGILGADLQILDIEPNKLVFSRDLVRAFDRLFTDFAPHAVYTHWNNDSHQDHSAVTNAVIATTRKNTCSVYMYEQTIPGGIVTSAFRHQLFVDISHTIDQKLAAVRAHRTQVENYDRYWVDGLKGRAMARGSIIGVQFAEAFEVVKEIGII